MLVGANAKVNQFPQLPASVFAALAHDVGGVRRQI
jgi:hypothetical protein